MKEETVLTTQMAHVYGPKHDEVATALFRNKEIMAPILQMLVDEFRDMSIEEIIECFSSDPSGDIFVDDFDMTIENQPTEMKALDEKLIRFDNRFTMRNPKLTNESILVKLYFDFEVQNETRESRLEYPLVKRGIYYMARMISSQLGQITKETNYSKVTKVYSIWICNDSIPKEEQNSVARYSFKKQDLIGYQIESDVNYDLMNLIMVKRGGNTVEKGIFEYLESVFDADIETMQKYSDVEWNEDIQEEVVKMTGLSDYYFDKGQVKGEKIGFDQGIQQGLEQGMRKSIGMLIKIGVSDEQIVQSVTEEFGVLDEEVRQIIGIMTK